MAEARAPAACVDIELDALWLAIEDAWPLAYVAEPLDLGLGQDLDGSSERSLSQYDRRRTFLAFYAWAVPTREAIESIRDFVGPRTLLEVCAGNGLWAHLLAASGLKVLATDRYSPSDTPYFPVEVEDAAAAVRSHPACEALFVSWPPLRNECAFEALAAFEGEAFVYAGDVRFTGDRRLHDLLRSEWTLEEQMLLPSWPGLDDSVYLYRRA